ncbi:MAG: family 43 glycosylhydrolase [Planctomycetes bacterium]|nr:family 43 glycosylhydrolase [Planctomycetota bacterium]
MGVLYRPGDSFLADVIPFHHGGAFHLFYLRDWRNAAVHGEGVPWWYLATRDFVTFDDLGEALPRGPIGSQDAWVFTGCVMEHAGVFHIFYTGHNHHLTKVGRPAEAVMHATSTDLKSWTKDEGFALFAPVDRYAADDWRDPFVFWNEEAGEFWMLLAARQRTGPAQRRGCTALCASKDLKRWEVREPFWAPQQYFTHECPDLFRMGDWWYLVFSEFSATVQTRYRMSRSLGGPWIAPANDTFDTRAFYAAKTASDGQRRYAFGWLPTRVGEKDTDNYQWGGELVVHEITQQPDGTLTVRVPESVAGVFGRTQPLALSAGAKIGAWDVKGDGATADARGRCSTLALGEMPEECMIEARVKVERPGATAGILLRTDDALDNYYVLRLEPHRKRMVLDCGPRPGDRPVLAERPIDPWPAEGVKLRVIVDGTCLVVYADDRVALSSRMYDHRKGRWGLYAADGVAGFTGVALRVR